MTFLAANIGLKEQDTTYTIAGIFAGIKYWLERARDDQYLQATIGPWCRILVGESSGSGGERLGNREREVAGCGGKWGT
nr:hypothetical protein [Tanacetum cinerariifolium]